jgi:hypothetical protein
MAMKHRKDSVRVALYDLENLQERFRRLAERETDPTLKGILSSLFNQVEIDVLGNGINCYKDGGE